jgi:hypothetical protein
MQNLVPSETYRWIGPAPTDCDICHRQIKKIFVDGATRQGPWGNMCLPCHSAFGVGLGTGKGQRYELQRDGRWAKMVPGEDRI